MSKPERLNAQNMSRGIKNAGSTLVWQLQQGRGNTPDSLNSHKIEQKVRCSRFAGGSADACGKPGEEQDDPIMKENERHRIQEIELGKGSTSQIFTKAWASDIKRDSVAVVWSRRRDFVVCFSWKTTQVHRVSVAGARR